MDGIAAPAPNAVTGDGADADVIAQMLLAVTIVYPAAGTYTYEISTPAGKSFSTTVIIAHDRAGVTTHETFGAPTPIATTDQIFDSELHERSFAAHQIGGNSLSIAFSPDAAVYTVGGKKRQLALDAPDCVLVDDNVLTSSVMLPAVIATTNSSQCAYVLSTSIGALEADIVDNPSGMHPAHAAAGDSAITMRYSEITETVWYDPRTLIPDFIDFGSSGTAVLTSAAP